MLPNLIVSILISNWKISPHLIHVARKNEPFIQTSYPNSRIEWIFLTLFGWKAVVFWSKPQAVVDFLIKRLPCVTYYIYFFAHKCSAYIGGTLSLKAKRSSGSSCFLPFHLIYICIVVSEMEQLQESSNFVFLREQSNWKVIANFSIDQ